jgi:hypothetical protein
MNAPFETPPAVDLLATAIGSVQRRLEQAKSNRERARIFWMAVVCAHNLASSDIVADDFRSLAIDTRLSAELGCQTIEHLIGWGLLNHDPFGDRPTWARR